MIREGIHTNAIYQHYKGAYYKVIDVAQDAEDLMPPVVIYHKSDINGIFKSIRNDVIVHQPFYTSINRFIGANIPTTRSEITREILPSELSDGVVPRFRFVKDL